MAERMAAREGNCRDLVDLIVQKADSLYGEFFVEFALKENTRFFCDLYGIENTANRSSRSQSVVRVSATASADVKKHATEVSSGIICGDSLTDDGLSTKEAIINYINGGRELPTITGATLADLKLIAEGMAPAIVNGSTGRTNHLDNQSRGMARARQIYGNIGDILKFWDITNGYSVQSMGKRSIVEKLGRTVILENANCQGVDPDLFFPERGASVKEAKAVCRGCVDREECLNYALDTNEKFGIWGGLSERERRRVRRQRSIARQALQGEEYNQGLHSQIR